MPWTKANINTLFASICNLNTNYTNTGYVDEDLYLHQFQNSFGPNQARVSGYCSAKNDGSNIFGEFRFNVVLERSYFDSPASKKYINLLGRMQSIDTDQVRSFEIKLVKKSTHVLNGKVRKDLHMGVEQVVVYPYFVDEDAGVIPIDEPLFIEGISRGPLDLVDDWIIRNLKSYNILRISFLTMKWNWKNSKLLYRVRGAHSLRGYRYFYEDSNLMLNDLNLWAHEMGYFKRFGGKNNRFATDIFMGINSSNVKACSYANNDDATKEKPPVFISLEDCANFH